MQVENIEEWKGQEVVDRDGEKVGKLDEVFSERGGSDPVVGIVKSGLLGRELHVVPLADASLSRGHVRLAVAKDQVKGSPTVASTDAMTRDEEVAFARHYGVGDAQPRDDADPTALRYESATAVRARREAREADLARAATLEAEADQLSQDAAEADQAAAAAADRGANARQRQSDLLREAHGLRHAHGEAPDAPPAPPGSPGRE